MNETLEHVLSHEEIFSQILTEIDPKRKSKCEDTDGLFGGIERYLEKRNSLLLSTYLIMAFQWDSNQIQDFLQALDKLSL